MNPEIVTMVGAALTPAGRLQVIQDLIRAPVVNEEGEVIGYECMITLDEARTLLMLEPE